MSRTPIERRERQLKALGPGLSQESPSEVWYRDGLRFICQRCGSCCGKEPGFVWVTERELEKMAQFLKLSREAFVQAYVRQVGNRWSLREKPNWDCVLHDRERGCLVYPVRPRQCRSLPFWPTSLHSPSAWLHLASRCPGANQGRFYSLREIRDILAGKRDTETSQDT